MPEERFCQLCMCAGNRSDGMPDEFNKNWPCPVMGEKKICMVCCQFDLEGGLAATDTLADICKISGKTPWEVHQACVKCPHGGRGLAKPRKLVSVRGDDGKQKRSGPEFRKAQEESLDWHRDRIEWLKVVTIEELLEKKPWKKKRPAGGE